MITSQTIQKFFIKENTGAMLLVTGEMSNNSSIFQIKFIQNNHNLQLSLAEWREIKSAVDDMIDRATESSQTSPDSTGSAGCNQPNVAGPF